MGDLSLALDPHPAPDTPAHTESLELSTLDDETREQPADNSEGQDQSGRAFPPLKAHLNVKDKSSGKIYNDTDTL